MEPRYESGRENRASWDQNLEKGMSKKTPSDVSAYMAGLGAKGGAAKGASKRRGNKAHYRRVAQARWGKKSEDN